MRIQISLAVLLVTTLSSPLMAQRLSEDDGALRFDNEVSAFYDSNVLGNSSEESDIELAYKPTLNFTRRSGLLGVDASIGGGFGWFLDNSNLDYQDFYSSFLVDYPNEASFPYKLTLGGGYSNSTRLDRFVGDRVAVDSTRLNLGFRYNANERWGFNVTGRWSELGYEESRFTDQNTWGLGLDFVYIYSEKLDIFVGYGYSETSGVSDFQDHTFRVQAVGELTPKLTGTLGFGYQFRESQFGNTGDPYINVDLAWAVNERMEVAANAGIGYSTTSTGASGKRTTLGVVGSMAFGAAVTGSLGISYTDSEYGDFGLDRADDRIAYQTALAWQLGESAILTGSVTFEDSDSTVDTLVYDRLRAGLNFQVSF